MVFNSHATNQDIVSDIHWWTGSNATSYLIADKVRACNFALDRIVSLIMKSDYKWQWDDQNNSDLPIGTTTLVNAQRDYSTATTHLKIKKVRVKDSGGDWNTLIPIDDISDDLDNEENGLPRYYKKLGNSIFIYPKPASGYVTLASGLEVHFQRGASYFITTDTTKEPGFASQFHRLVPLYASRDYCMLNNPNRLSMIENEIRKLEEELKNFYENRDNDKSYLSTRIIKFR